MALDRLAAMETFVRVVDAGSFSAAAERLRVGQPAVSKAIAQLEERLGVRLLLRSTRRLSLTDAGRSFYESAKRAIENVEQAERAARGDAGMQGTLRVSATMCFARIHILPRLPEFFAAHPGLNIDVLLDDRLINLVEEGVDVALRTGALVDSSLTARRIGAASGRVMASPGYFEARGVPRTPEDLRDHEVVLLQRGNVTQDEWTFRRRDAEVAVKARGRLKVTSGEGLREAVLAGLGVAVVSEWLFTPELASGAVRAVLPEWTLPTQNLWAVFASGRLPSAKAQAFVSFVERVMAPAAAAQSPVALGGVAGRAGG